MKIISKFKDYYDSAMGQGVDRTKVFTRMTELVEYPNHGKLRDYPRIQGYQLGLLFNSITDRKLIAYRANQVLHYAQFEGGWAVSSDKTHLEDSLNLVGFDTIGEIKITDDLKRSTGYSAQVMPEDVGSITIKLKE